TPPTAPLFDDACWVGSRPTTQVLGATGNRRVYVYTKDVAENVSNAAATASINYSTTPPSPPSLAITDGTTGSGTYARQQTISINISNDLTAVRWCVSETQNVKPSLGTSTCNGGDGASSGWYTV